MVSRIREWLSVQRALFVALAASLTMALVLGQVMNNWHGAIAGGLFTFQVILVLDGIRLWRLAGRAHQEAIRAYANALEEIEKADPSEPRVQVVYLRRQAPQPNGRGRVH